MTNKIRFGAKYHLAETYEESADQFLTVIKYYQDQPLVSLKEAVQPIAAIFSRIEDSVAVALKYCQNSSNGLTRDESASIYLYTMEFDNGSSLYLTLNQLLRNGKLEMLKPWYSFLKLLSTALQKLSSNNGTIKFNRQVNGLNSRDNSKTKVPDELLHLYTLQNKTFSLDQPLDRYCQYMPRSSVVFEATNSMHSSFEHHSVLSTKMKSLMGFIKWSRTNFNEIKCPSVFHKQNTLSTMKAKVTEQEKLVKSFFNEVNLLISGMIYLIINFFVDSRQE